MEEFYEMADFYDWDRDEKEYPRDMLREALVEQFNSTYGVDEHSLAEWTNLCQLMGIHPIPTDLEGCRQVREQIISFSPAGSNQPSRKSEVHMSTLWTWLTCLLLA